MLLKNLVSTVYRKCFVLPCTHGEESVCSKQTLVFSQHEETGKISRLERLVGVSVNTDHASQSFIFEEDIIMKLLS